MDNRDSLFAFLLGATIGVAVGLLYAPRSGRQTRAHLRQLGEEFLDNAEEVSEEIKEKGKKFVDEGKIKVSEIVEKGKAAYSKTFKKPVADQHETIEE